MAKREKIVQDQGTWDIVREVKDAHVHFARDYDSIAKMFWKGSAKKTGEALFGFLKKNILYKAEPEQHQSTRSPSAIITKGVKRSNFNDCKHYASFIGGVLDSLKRQGYPIKWVYRFARYDPLERDPGHVFVVLKNGRETWIDPVLPSFDDKRGYIDAIDKKIDMPLYRISGNNGIGKKSAAKAERKAKPKKRILLKVGASPARNAFLGLVAINVNQFATKLAGKIKAGSEEAIKNKWVKLGGNYSKLRNTIQRAAAKHGVIIGVGSGCMRVAGIGVIPVAAGIAAALPVITALKEFLEGAGDAIAAGKAVVEDIANKAEVTQATGVQQAAPVIIPAIDTAGAPLSSVPSFQVQPAPAMAQGYFPPSVPTTTATVSVNKTPAGTTVNIQQKEGEAGIPFNFKSLLLPGAAAVGLWLISRRGNRKRRSTKRA